MIIIIQQFNSKNDAFHRIHTLLMIRFPKQMNLTIWDIFLCRNFRWLKKLYCSWCQWFQWFLQQFRYTWNAQIWGDVFLEKSPRKRLISLSRDSCASSESWPIGYNAFALFLTCSIVGIGWRIDVPFSHSIS